MVQLSHPYMTTGKIIALTRWIFVSKVTSLFLNMLSSLAIAILPRNKGLLISCLQSQSAVILEPPKIKSVTVSTVSSSIAMKWWDQMPWSSFFECWVLSQIFHSPLTVWITVNCGKFWKTWEYHTTWPASWEICMQVRKQQLELDREQQTGSKSGKE